MENLLNSDFLKLFVVLLAIVAIVFLFLKYRKDEEHPKIHIYYISGLCIFIVMELVTYICVNNDNATDIVSYVSFASTISSLFLSVVAIIYAIVSNNKGEAQYQKIDRASDRISNSVDKFSVLSEGMSGNINSILAKLDEIKNISNETKNAISNTIQPNPNVLKGNIMISELFENFIKYGSYSGNLALLACCYSYEMRKPFKTVEVFGANASYSYGYIIASSVSGIISTRAYDDFVKVIGINLSNMKELLKKQIDEYIKTSAPENLDYNVNVYEKIKRFFGVTE